MTKLIDLSIECKEGGKTEVKIDETPPAEVKSDRWGGIGVGWVGCVVQGVSNQWLNW